MVSSFRLTRVPRAIFRCGAISELPEQAAGYGPAILLVTGARSFAASPEADRLREQLSARRAKVHLKCIGGEPSPAVVDGAVGDLRGAGISLVVSIGGGSVMDAGKAISAMLTADGSVVDYLEVVGNREHPGTKIPFIAVPTTSGTGSEATKNAVISRVGNSGFKRSLRHDNFVPDLALIDPELTLKCPPAITAAAGMDCFTQLTEAFLSPKADEFTDALAMKGIAAIKRSLVRSFTDGDNIDARSDMSFAAFVSGICLANAGLGAVHGLAGTIGALHGIPHGVVCGTLMSGANEMNVRVLRRSKGSDPALNKYARLGRLFSDTESHGDDYYVDFFIDYLRAVTFRLRLPCLGDYGLLRDDVPSIVSQSDVKNNPVKLSDYELTEIITGRL